MAAKTKGPMPEANEFDYHHDHPEKKPEEEDLRKSSLKILVRNFSGKDYEMEELRKDFHFQDLEFEI